MEYEEGQLDRLPPWCLPAYYRLCFWGQVETAIISGIKSRFGIIGYSTSEAILSLWFFSL